MPITRDEILLRLSALAGPGGRALTTEADAIEIALGTGRVDVAIGIKPADAARWEASRLVAQTAIRGLDGAGGATVTLTASASGRTPVAPAGGQHVASPPASPPAAGFPALAEIGHIVAVASGKGGVGKSTTACNLALALAAEGLAVGLLDADIYGPSMPRLFGLRAKPKVVGERTLVPLDGYGVKVMSIGFVVEEAKALVWRGPMVMGAITQMLRDVAWGRLDVLIVDMPPGTGDAQLTLAQNARLSGAIIVSTPQDLALIDARKGVAMFREVGVPILGLVENMSYFVCDECGKRHEIFSHGGAAKEAARLDVPLLAEIALDPIVRERSDAGLPIVVTEPDSAPALAYRELARRVRRCLTAEMPEA